MTSQVKSGNEMLDEFFDRLHELPGVDKDIADMLVVLYRKGILTHKQISNALLRLQKEADDDED